MTKSDVERVETWFGGPLPEPYRSFLSRTAIDILVPGGTLVYACATIVERNDTFETKEYCPNCLAIGDDGGGSAIVLSLNDGAIYRVDIGAMTPDCFEPVARSFEKWVASGFLGRRGEKRDPE